MIICSCNIISSANIQLTIERLVAEDRDAMITPGMVYHAMGKKPDCRGCMPNFVALVYKILDRMREEGRYLPPARPKRRRRNRPGASRPGRPENVQCEFEEA